MSYILIQGSKNVLRFGSEFLSLDGLQPAKGWKIHGVFRTAQNILRTLPKNHCPGHGAYLRGMEPRVPFSHAKGAIAHEDSSYWGVMGFSLIWVVVLLSLLGVVRSQSARVLALAAIVFLLVQSYAGPYDPWRGRYFIMAAVFAVPPVAALLEQRLSKAVRLYIAAVVAFGCLSASVAVLLRSDSPILSTAGHPSVFEMDRIGRLTRSAGYADRIGSSMHWSTLTTTVAVDLPGESYEYPLFGHGLTRHLIPINWFRVGYRPPPKEAQFLLFMSGANVEPTLQDVDLGGGWYLRRLR